MSLIFLPGSEFSYSLAPTSYILCMIIKLQIIVHVHCGPHVGNENAQQLHSSKQVSQGHYKVVNFWNKLPSNMSSVM